MNDNLGMAPYPMIFPDAEEGVVGVTLRRKVGKAKAGEYRFIEAYCVEQDCDCRRAAILVVNDKSKHQATIEFGFDPDEPLAGPYLNEYVKQASGAGDLLRVFVDLINGNPDWLKGIYRHYKEVRKKVDGRSYRGKAFPKPGSVVRFIKPPEEEEEDIFEEFHRLLDSALRMPQAGGRKKKGAAKTQGPLFTEEYSDLEDMADWIERYRHDADIPFGNHDARQTELRSYLLNHDRAADDLAKLLVTFFEEESEIDHLDAAMHLLTDSFEILRADQERRRPGTQQRMEDWQAALARHIFAAGVDPHLGTLVTQVLLNARVEILPLLHDANAQRMLAHADFVADPAQALLGLLGELEEQGTGNPHELFEAVLQMMAVGNAKVQVNLCHLMLGVDHPVIREAAVLMLFHPHAEVRAGVAQLLAEVDGRWLTPTSLRRLIVARNWFPESLRTHIDQVVTNARRARVECAPLPKRVEMTVHSSAVDGANAQTFQVLIPEKKGFLCCSIMPKKGHGVADAFLLPLAGKGERNDLLNMMRSETGAIEVSTDYLHKRICQALADGARHDKVPCHWLVAIAERLGTDQWKASPLNIAAELATLRDTLERRGGKFVTPRYRQQALVASESWAEEQPFAWSWFEDDVEVDEIVQKTLVKKRRPDPDRCIAAILEKIIQPRRAQWLERLVLTTLWLKAAKTPAVPWEEMFYVSEAVADEKMPLAEIPLMVMIAGLSFGAFIGRQEEGR
ncbi:MAG: hypothetical protein IBX46_07810 [Desulfuromonadales bacterium]|nr:hypothetical protein [Desulfuromonadales bacterium]